MKRLDGLRVLILEDDYFIAEDAKQALEDAGATVMGPFSRVHHALKALEATVPDAALVDINLGDGPDFKVAELAVSLGVKVVFMTGYSASVIPSALSRLPVVQKPMRPDAIVAAMAAASGDGETGDRAKPNLL